MSQIRLTPRFTVSARLSAILAVVALTGCLSFKVGDMAPIYYSYGPTVMLDMMDEVEVPDAERSLSGRDRAVALLELGRYEAAIEALLLAMEEMPLAERPWPMKVRSQSGAFVGEAHEQIMTPTLALSAALALQDWENASDWADRCLAMARDLDLHAHQAPATWVLSALAYEAAGRIGASHAAFYEAAFAAESDSEVAAAVEHLTLADPVERSLVVVMLLGEGPFKSEGTVRLPSRKIVAWPDYEHEAPSLTVTVTIDDGQPAAAMAVEDLWMTAIKGIGRRFDEILEAADGDGVDDEQAEFVGNAVGVDKTAAAGILSVFQEPPDLLSWATLPATFHLVRVPVPDESQEAALRLEDEDGKKLWREVFRIPEAWESGPLFVVRRVP